MIDSLKYFFRSTTDSSGIEFYGFLHLTMLLVFFLGIYMILINRKKLQQNFWLVERIKKIFSIVIFLEIILMYSWYLFGDYMGLKDGLPIYHCRIVLILVVLYTFKPFKWLKLIIINWGLVGATIAMLIPVGDPFIFPHVTYVTYFVGHIFLGWYVMLLIVGERYRFPISDLRNIIILGIIFNLFQVIVNNYLGSNYGYVSQPPVLKEYLSAFSPFIYNIIMCLVYALGSILVHMAGNSMFTNNKVKNYKENKKYLF